MGTVDSPDHNGTAPAGRKQALEILFVSCVDYAPLDGLVRALRRKGQTAAVLAPYRDLEWRNLRSGGRLAGARARLVSLLWLPLRMLAAALRPGRRLIVATTNPFHLTWLAVLLRPLHRQPVVILAYDMYPDALEAAGMVAPDSWRARLAARGNRFAFNRADGVVFIGERMKEHAVSRYGAARKSTVIPTGASPVDDRPEAPGDTEHPVIFSYVGNLGHLHDWQTLATGIERLTRSQEAQFVIAASGAGGTALKEVLRTRPVEPSVRLEPPLGEAEWQSLLATTSVSLVSLKSDARNVSVPSKLFSAMGAGNAILAVAPSDSDLADVVGRHGCGLVVEPGDVDGLIAAAEQVIADRSLLRKMQQNALTAVREEYSFDACGDKWLDFVRRVVGPVSAKR